MTNFDANTLRELRDLQEVAIRTEKHPKSTVAKPIAATPASSSASVLFRRRTPPASGQAGGAAVTRSGAAFCRSSYPDIVTVSSTPLQGRTDATASADRFPSAHYIVCRCLRLMRRLDPPNGSFTRTTRSVSPTEAGERLLHTVGPRV